MQLEVQLVRIPNLFFVIVLFKLSYLIAKTTYSEFIWNNCLTIFSAGGDYYLFRPVYGRRRKTNTEQESHVG